MIGRLVTRSAWARHLSRCCKHKCAVLFIFLHGRSRIIDVVGAPSGHADSAPTWLKILWFLQTLPRLDRHGLNDHATPWLNRLRSPVPLIKARVTGFRVPRAVILAPRLPLPIPGHAQRQSSLLQYYHLILFQLGQSDMLPAVCILFYCERLRVIKGEGALEGWGCRQIDLHIV